MKFETLSSFKFPIGDEILTKPETLFGFTMERGEIKV